MSKQKRNKEKHQDDDIEAGTVKTKHLKTKKVKTQDTSDDPRESVKENFTSSSNDNHPHIFGGDNLTSSSSVAKEEVSNERDKYQGWISPFVGKDEPFITPSQIQDVVAKSKNSKNSVPKLQKEKNQFWLHLAKLYLKRYEELMKKASAEKDPTAIEQQAQIVLEKSEDFMNQARMGEVNTTSEERERLKAKIAAGGSFLFGAVGLCITGASIWGAPSDVLARISQTTGLGNSFLLLVVGLFAVGTASAATKKINQARVEAASSLALSQESSDNNLPATDELSATTSFRSLRPLRASFRDRHGTFVSQKKLATIAYANSKNDGFDVINELFTLGESFNYIVNFSSKTPKEFNTNEIYVVNNNNILEIILKFNDIVYFLSESDNPNKSIEGLSEEGYQFVKTKMFTNYSKAQVFGAYIYNIINENGTDIKSEDINNFVNLIQGSKSL